MYEESLVVDLENSNNRALLNELSIEAEALLKIKPVVRIINVEASNNRAKLLKNLRNFNGAADSMHVRKRRAAAAAAPADIAEGASRWHDPLCLGCEQCKASRKISLRKPSARVVFQPSSEQAPTIDFENSNITIEAIGSSTRLDEVDSPTFYELELESPRGVAISLVVLSRDDSATAIQMGYRRQAVGKRTKQRADRNEEDRSLSVIQRTARKHLGCSKASRCRVRRDLRRQQFTAASHIQKNFRGFVFRRFCFEKREAREYQKSAPAIVGVEGSAVELGEGHENLGLSFARPEKSTAVPTGFKIWPSSAVMVQYLQYSPEMVTGKKVLELGAGTGISGLTAAACCNAHETILTDQDPRVLRLLRQNVSAHLAERSSAGHCRISVERLDWTSKIDVTMMIEAGNANCDVVLVVDNTYPDMRLKDAQKLFASISRLLHSGEGAKAIMVHQHRQPATARHLATAAAEEGFSMHQLDLDDFLDVCSPGDNPLGQDDNVGKMMTIEQAAYLSDASLFRLYVCERLPVAEVG
jgi:predicted nicotinamide N-methyase